VKHKTILIFILILIVCTPLIYSLGTCTLDEDGSYRGGTATFLCSCTTGVEKNVPGFIVFRIDNGTILQSIATNSNDCIGSLFGDSYTFSNGDDFSGNATFSLNADGTGDPAGWATDINFDNFTVSPATSLDCIIQFPNGSITYTLGELSAAAFYVLDGVTMNPIVNAKCTLNGYGVNGIPLLFEPYYTTSYEVYSVGDGHTHFQHLMNDNFWQVSTSYVFEAHCVCFDNSSFKSCYDSITGERTNFKSCNGEYLFTTSAIDKRNLENDDNMTSEIMGLALIGLMFIGLGFSVRKSRAIKLLGFGIAFIQVMLIAFLIYNNDLGFSSVNMLKINFVSLFLIGGGFAFIALLKYTIRLMNPADTIDDDTPKWQKYG